MKSTKTIYKTPLFCDARKSKKTVNRRGNAERPLLSHKNPRLKHTAVRVCVISVAVHAKRSSYPSKAFHFPRPFPHVVVKSKRDDLTESPPESTPSS
jgi:hypothetical protein